MCVLVDVGCVERNMSPVGEPLAASGAASLGSCEMEEVDLEVEHGVRDV